MTVGRMSLGENKMGEVGRREREYEIETERADENGLSSVHISWI